MGTCALYAHAYVYVSVYGYMCKNHTYVYVCITHNMRMNTYELYALMHVGFMKAARQYIHTYIHICTYIHTYIHTYINIYIYIYIYILLQVPTIA